MLNSALLKTIGLVSKCVILRCLVTYMETETHYLAALKKNK